MRNDWHKFFFEQAKAWASRSKDPDRKVGAIIVDLQRRIVSTGYNGPPRGVIDYAELPNERKNLRTSHAEINAILTAPRDLFGTTMYTTTFPCANPCMTSIIQVGIKTVRVLTAPELPSKWEDSWNEAVRMAQEAGVQIIIGEG